MLWMRCRSLVFFLSGQVKRQCALVNGINRQAPLRHVRRCPGNHFDAVDDGAHAQAESAAGAAVHDYRKMGLRVKLNSLQKKRKGREKKAITLEQLSTLHRRISPLLGELFMEVKKATAMTATSTTVPFFKGTSWAPSSRTGFINFRLHLALYVFQMRGRRRWMNSPIEWPPKTAFNLKTFASLPYFSKWNPVVIAFPKIACAIISNYLICASVPGSPSHCRSCSTCHSWYTSLDRRGPALVLCCPAPGRRQYASAPWQSRPLQGGEEGIKTARASQRNSLKGSIPFLS